MYKIDLHTHSIASPDGSLKAEDYKAMLASGKLDVIAVTDHDTISFAKALHDELGDQIIIGEEITTTQGEIIGLYLEKLIKPGLSLSETITQIRQQKGLVYVPHPFETIRKGISQPDLEQVAREVDIIEIFNGRAYFQDKSQLVANWAAAHHVAAATSSDAHGQHGWGKTYILVQELPSCNNLVGMLRSARYSQRRVGLLGMLYPKLNRLKKGLRRAQ